MKSTTEKQRGSALLSLQRTAWLETRQLLQSHGVSLPLGTRMMYGWRSRLHSLTWRAERRSNAGGDLPVALFACGFWRSGTTLLHECLSRDPRWRAPTTQECMNPGQPTPGSGQQVTQRPMDNLPIAADSPQEDEFALLNLGAPSFYRVLLCPGAWREQLAELSSGDAHLSWPKREAMLREFCDWLQVRDPRGLLLKSPTHSFAIARLLALASQAHAVVILRDWRDVWRSCLKMWSTMFGLYSLGPWTPDDVTRMTHAAMLEYAHSLPKQLQAIDGARIAVVRYEDLTASPVSTIGAIYEKFSLSMPMGMPDLIDDFVVKTRPSATKNLEIQGSTTAHAQMQLADAYDALRLSIRALEIRAGG